MSKFDYAIEILEEDLKCIRTELAEYKGLNLTKYEIHKDELESNIQSLESAIRRLKQKIIHTGQFVGLEIRDFYCNGFFGRDYDLDGAIIVASGQDYITIRKTNGYTTTAHFEEGWQLDEMENLIYERCQIKEEE
jgi:hypothetical protein